MLNYYRRSGFLGEPADCIPGDGVCIEFPAPFPDDPEDEDGFWAQMKTGLAPLRERIQQVRAQTAKSVVRLTGRQLAPEGFFSVPSEKDPEYSAPLADLMESINILIHDNLRGALRDVDKHVNRARYKGPAKVALAVSKQGALRLVWVKEHKQEHSHLELEAVKVGKTAHRVRAV